MNGQPTTDTIPDSIRMENAPCPCGCPAGDAPVIEGGDRLNGLPGHFFVVQCNTCGLKRTDPRPSQASMGYYYPADYDPYTATRVAVAPARRKGWKGLARRIFDTRSTAMPDVEPGRMLEIGCASGSFMQQMADRGWDVQGLEPSSEAAEFARERGFEVSSIDLESANYPEESFDMIVGWMVLEHLHSPVECLRKMNKWLRPGGWLVFSVPNAGSYELGLFRDAWFALQLPTHLYHYEPRTMDAVLASAGWRRDRIIFQRSNGNIAFTLGYLLQEVGLKRLGNYMVSGKMGASLAFRLLTFPYAWAAAKLGMAGRMTVWAKKA